MLGPPLRSRALLAGALFVSGSGSAVAVWLLWQYATRRRKLSSSSGGRSLGQWLEEYTDSDSVKKCTNSTDSTDSSDSTISAQSTDSSHSTNSAKSTNSPNSNNSTNSTDFSNSIDSSTSVSSTNSIDFTDSVDSLRRGASGDASATLTADQFAERETQRCTWVEEVLATLRSLGGHTLKGHTLGVPDRHRTSIEISTLIKEYRRELADRAWVASNRSKLQVVSEALDAVLLANERRPLVLEVSAGFEVEEVKSLATTLLEALGNRRSKDLSVKMLADAQRFWLQRAFARSLPVEAEAVSALPIEVEELIWSMQDRRQLSAATERFRLWLRRNLKSANCWVMYDQDSSVRMPHLATFDCGCVA